MGHNLTELIGKRAVFLSIIYSNIMYTCTKLCM